ncbi:MAG: exonuclease subunit SbcD [Pontibacterium sp.]
MVKLLHTSDWHLGQHFMGQSRRHEHQQFLNWLRETAVAQNVTAIVVAGDIFDTGAPPSYAREMYNHFVVELEKVGVHLVILGGNHDSIATLSETASLLRRLGAHVIPGAMATPEEQLVSLNNQDGRTELLVCAVPFLRPRDVMTSQSGDSTQSKQKQLQNAISEHYQRIYQLAKTKQQAIFKSEGRWVPIVATGHLTTVGAKTSDAVREIYIGTLDHLPSSAFPEVDYVALGHIHRHQKVGKTEHIRYCGSPIPLSFDELSSDKVVLLALLSDEHQGDRPDNAGALLEEIEPVSIPRFQPMYRVKGTIEEVETQFDALAKAQEADESQATTAWVEVTITGESFVVDLQQRIQDKVADLPLEVLCIRRQKVAAAQLKTEQKETLAQLTPQDVFHRRLESEAFDEAQTQRLNQAFHQLAQAAADHLSEKAEGDNA